MGFGSRRACAISAFKSAPEALTVPNNPSMALTPREAGRFWLLRDKEPDGLEGGFAASTGDVVEAPVRGLDVTPLRREPRLKASNTAAAQQP